MKGALGKYKITKKVAQRGQTAVSFCVFTFLCKHCFFEVERSVDNDLNIYS